MTRPIPLFRFVFAAYYATQDTADYEAPSVAHMSLRARRAVMSHLVLVVDNGVAAKPTTRATRVGRALECKIDG